MRMGEGQNADFTPVELLLAALAACEGLTVESLVAKRAEPVRFDMRVDADKVKDQDGSHLVDIVVSLDVAFPDDEAGRKAESRLEVAMSMTHEKLCSVGRTITLATDHDFVRQSSGAQ